MHPVPSFFFLRVGGRFEKIAFADMVFVEANKNYCKLHTTHRVYWSLTTLKAVEAVLPPGDFCRIHRSFLVSLTHLTAFDRRTAYLPGHKLPIGESYYHHLEQRVLILTDSHKQPGYATAHLQNHL
ncbi:MAG TPA: LytTR family DNA-binding domain-containing protein [Puia sp.]